MNDHDEWLDPADGEPCERVTSAWWWLLLAAPAAVCLIVNATRGVWS